MTVFSAIPNALGSPIAAAASAAHDVLVKLFPSQSSSLDLALEASLAKYGLTDADDGIDVGRQAAACVKARVDADNVKRALPDTFIGTTTTPPSWLPGEWQPTSTTISGAPAGMTAQFISVFTPFAMNDPTQFRASQAPPTLESGAYTKAYNEVKALGAKENSSRTDDQTKIGNFFAGSPPAYWNGAVQGLVVERALDLGDTARLFALLNISLGDAIITAWDSKIAWNFWRPITGIHNGDHDGNPNTVGDPPNGSYAGWQPLFGTPNYPDYTSGANNLAGAAATTVANFFGTDEVHFFLKNSLIAGPDGVREYFFCSAAAQDVVDGRIYMGIHFRFADAVALRQGTRVANWVFGHYLRPIGSN